MIRRAVCADAETIAAIDRCADAHRPWTKEMFRDALSDPLYTFYVYEADGVPVGFGCVRDVGGEAELEYIAVAEEFRRRGIAGSLMDALISAARAGGAQAVFLEAGAQNRPALALYEKHGFAALYTRKNYYGQGKDAVVLKKVLPAP